MASPHRWRASLVAMLIVPLLLLAACGSSDDEGSDGSGTSASSGSSAACEPSRGNVTIEFWSWVPGIEQAVDLWNRENPRIQVDLKKVPDGSTGGTYQRYSNAIRAGRGAPDLGMIEFDTLPVYRLQNALTDIGPCGAAEAQDEFVDFVWPQVTFGEDAVYAIPEDTGPLVLYYRADLFRRYGIEVPRTWADFAAAAASVQAQDRGVHLTNISSVMANWFAGLAWQNGARWFARDADSWSVSIADDATLEVADFWQRLIDADQLSTVQTFTEEWNRAAANGRILSWVSAAWGSKLIELGAPGTRGKWAVAPMPQWEEGALTSANYGGSTYAVFNTSEHPYESTQFALWLNTDPASVEILNREGGAYPAALSGLELPALTEPQPFFGGQQIYDVINEAAANIDNDWVWGPTMANTFATLGDAMGRVIDKRQTFREAIEETQSKTVEDMESQSLTVTTP